MALLRIGLVGYVGMLCVHVWIQVHARVCVACVRVSVSGARGGGRVHAPEDGIGAGHEAVLARAVDDDGRGRGLLPRARPGGGGRRRRQVQSEHADMARRV